MEIGFNEIYSRPPNFCSQCGDLLDFEIIRDNFIVCQKCNNLVDINIIISHQLESKNEYYNYKEWKDKLENKEDRLKKQQDIIKSTIRQDCIKCDSKKFYYYTMQLRNADEGSTVFYECVKCHYKFSIEN